MADKCDRFRVRILKATAKRNKRATPVYSAGTLIIGYAYPDGTFRGRAGLLVHIDALNTIAHQRAKGWLSTRALRSMLRAARKVRVNRAAQANDK